MNLIIRRLMAAGLTVAVMFSRSGEVLAATDPFVYTETKIEELISEDEESEQFLYTAGETVDSGTCGDNLTWTLTALNETDLKLTITGTGEMNDNALLFTEHINRTKINKIEINEGLTSIGASAFVSFSSLTSIDLPSSLTSIGNYAFRNCSSLASIELPSGVTSIGTEAFSYCSSLASIELPSGVTSIGTYTFLACSSLTSIELPSNLTSIGFRAFGDCISLTSIELPSGVTSIGDYAFENCSGLTSIELPSSLTSIGNLAFSVCSSLTSIKLPSGVTSIGAGAFRYCSSLASIELPSSLTNIEQNTFENCLGLTSIELPSGVTSIGAGAFDVCNNLTDIYYGGSVDDWNKIDIASYHNYRLYSAVIHYNNFTNTSTSVPRGSYRFRVLDAGNVAVSDASIKFRFSGQSAQEKTTDGNGYATFDLGGASLGSPYIEVSKDGYMTWTNESINYSLNNSRYEEIILYPDDAEYSYKLQQAQLVNMNYGDMLRYTKTLYLSNISTINTDTDFKLYCKAWKPDQVASYRLYQGEKQIAESADGLFDLNTRQFSEGGGCYIAVIPSDGSNAVNTSINLKFAKKQDEKVEFSVGKKTKFKVGQDIPVFGGSELSFDFPVLPVDFLVSDEKIHIGINLKGLKDFNDAKKRDEVKKKLDSLNKAANTTLNKSSIGALVKESNSGELPGFDSSGKPVKFNVVGYLEADPGDSVAKGMLYIEVSAKADVSWTFVIVVVPVAVNIEGKLKAKAGGELKWNLSTGNFTGRLFFDPSAKLEVFGGVGVGDVISAGVYGSAEATLQINIVDTNNNTGLRKVDLTGEFGGKVYAGPFEYKKAWAYQTWNLYTATNGVRSPALQASAPDETDIYSGFDITDVSAYEPVDLSYLATGSDWYGGYEQLGSDGDELSALFDSSVEDTDASFTALKENTYHNAQLSAASDGTGAWLTFLGADAKSGAVSTMISRFDPDAGKWSEPVKVNTDAIIDDAPQILCAGGELWLAYSEATEDYNSAQPTVLGYAKNRRVRALRINKETLAVEESRTYTGSGFVAGQALSEVNGRTVLSWTDGALTDENSIFAPESTAIYYADLSSTDKEAVRVCETKGAVRQAVAGQKDGNISVGYIDDKGDLYLCSGGEPVKKADEVGGRLSYGKAPGSSQEDFMWNIDGALHTLSGSDIAAEGITSYYDVEGDSVFYSAVSEVDGYKTELKETRVENGEVRSASVIKAFDGKYLEDLNALTVGGEKYITAMNTRATITEDDIALEKDLIFTSVREVHDIAVVDVEFDEEIITAGEAVPVKLTVQNSGEKEVSRVEVSVNGALKTTSEVNIEPGASGDIAFNIECPSDTTVYDISVAEPGIAESSLRSGDNNATITLCEPDLSVDMKLVMLDGQKGFMVTATNEGGGTADGTVTLYDRDGEVYASQSTGNLNSGDIAVMNFWVSQGRRRFLGDATAVLTTDGGDRYEFNNKASVYADWEDEGEIYDEPDFTEQTEIPTASPVSGTVLERGDKITLSSGTGGAVIYYTTDGTTPTTDSTVYTAPVDAEDIAAGNKVTIKAIAVAPDFEQSDIAIFAWTLADRTAVLGISLDKTELSLKAGETATLTATVTPESATEKGIIWSSDNESVATVTEGGVVTAITVGKANITAETKSRGYKAICAVEVTKESSGAGSVSGDNGGSSSGGQQDGNTDTGSSGSDTGAGDSGAGDNSGGENSERVSQENIFAVGGKATLKADFAVKKWKTSNKKIATVSKKGVVKAGKKAGTVTITAIGKGKNAQTKEWVLTVEKPKLSFGTVRTKDTFAIKDKLSGTKLLYPVKYTSSKDNVLSVASDGTVTVKKSGKTKVTVWYEHGKVTSTVTVKLPGIKQGSASVKTGKSKKLKLLNKGGGVNITMVSSDVGVVTVADNGKLTGVSPGTATVTLLVNGEVYDTCAVTVKP